MKVSSLLILFFSSYNTCKADIKILLPSSISQNEIKDLGKAVESTWYSISDNPVVVEKTKLIVEAQDVSDATVDPNEPNFKITTAIEKTLFLVQGINIKVGQKSSSPRPIKIDKTPQKINEKCTISGVHKKRKSSIFPHQDKVVKVFDINIQCGKRTHTLDSLEFHSDEKSPPSIVWSADLNDDGFPELMFKGADTSKNEGGRWMYFSDGTKKDFKYSKAISFQHQGC